MISLLSLIVGCVLIFQTTVVAQELELPEISRRVTDLTGTLSSQQVQALEANLAQFERETSNQVAVLIVPSLEGESLEDYSIRVAEKNKFGKKGRDNGVLLLIFMKDRKLRIEVGYGLEGALPDATAIQIIRNVIRPKFREGNYYAGIRDGINAIMLATKGEFEGVPTDKKPRGVSLFHLLFFLLFFGLPIFLFSKRLRGSSYVGGSRGWRSGGLMLGGGGFSGGGGGFGGGGFSGGGGGFGGGGAGGGW